MNFLKAIQHATIGYGIRRRDWANKNAILTIDNLGQLYWLNHTHCNTPAKLGGTDLTYDLTVQDIQANDWEAV